MEETKHHEQKAFHYLPQFLLEGFKTGSFLHEFNIRTGVSGKKAINEAGSREHFYRSELERGYLQRIDNEAGDIFHKHFSGPHSDIVGGKFILTPDVKLKLASFLALFTLRTPAAFERTKAHVAFCKENPKAMIEVIRECPSLAYDSFKAANPAKYAALVAENGEKKTHETIVNFMIESYETGRIKGDVNVKNVFNHGISETQATAIGTALSKLKWMLIDTKEAMPFFISDFPLCVWRDGKHVGFETFTSTDVEITFPLTHRLTLLMRHAGTEVQITPDLILNYNFRQLFAAQDMLYGSARLTKMVKLMHEFGKAGGHLPDFWHPGPAGWSPQR